MPSARRSASRLPTPLDSFVGRDRELVELESLLDRHRLVTLLGPGGAGKTRLSTELAARVQRHYPDGVWLVEFGSITDPGLLAQTVAVSLDVPEQPGRPVLDSLTDLLADQQALLVLDNCEHVVADAARLVEELLRHCPHLQILTTSREPLELPGEAAFRVGELSLPELTTRPTRNQLLSSDAVRLFVERARASAPDFTLTDENAPDVAAVCARLDGMPLAIELAARRARLLPVAEINARLDERFRLLTVGSRTAADRHRDLRTTIEWSYDLLKPDERDVFRRLSVLVGGFSLHTAAVVCCDDAIPADDMLDLLASLEARSLIVPERSGDTGRFRQLESIRLYGRERLAAEGETDGTFERLVVHLLELADPVIGGSMLHCYEDLQPLDVERANLLAAVEWAARRRDPRHLPLATALGRCWRYHGYAADGLTLLQTALEASGPAHPDRGAALAQASALASSQGDHPKALALATEAIEFEQRSEQHAIGLVRALDLLGQAHLGAGRADDAVDAARRCHAAVQYVGGPLDTAVCLHNYAWNCLVAGDIEGAGELLEQCLPLYRKHSLHPLPPEWLHTAGILALARGDAEAAEGYLREGLEPCLAPTDAGTLPAVSLILIDGLVIAATERGEPLRAVRLAAAAAALRRARRLQLGVDQRRELEAALAKARTQVSGADAQAAEAQGSRLSAAQALSYAVRNVWADPAGLDAGDLPLTRRERAVAELVATGLTNREIAARIHVAERTVESHLERIRTKLDLRSRTQLAAWATEHLADLHQG